MALFEDFTATGHDQDEPGRLEELKELLDIVAGFSEAESDEQIVQQALRWMCARTGWEYGRGTILDLERSPQQTVTTAWPAPPPGDESLFETPPARRFSFPMNETTTLLLEFFSTKPAAEPGPALIELLEAFGRQLGKGIQRRRAGEQLRWRAENLTRLVESVKDIAFFTLDLEGRVTSWNKGAEKIKGYQRNEIIGKHFSIFYTPQAIAANKPQQALEIACQEGRFDTEDWRVRKDGSLFWANIILFPLYDSSGVLQGYTKLTRDLTKRKKMEEELQENQARHQRETAELRRRLMEGREAERLQMAQELHDGPIQDLYGLIFSIDAIAARIRSQAARDQLAEMKGQLQGIVGTLRALMGDLRPPTIAPFGLEKAIRSHIQSFQEAHPEYQIELNLESDHRTLPEDFRLALYRIYQSSLSNIVRHAEATQISICFKLDDENIRLEIRDNGKGFEVPEHWIRLARRGHLGLVGAQERAEAIGGALTVESKTGEGTRVIVVAPRSAINNNEDKD